MRIKLLYENWFPTGIAMGDLPYPCAYAGDHVVLTLTGMDIDNVSIGKHS